MLHLAIHTDLEGMEAPRFSGYLLLISHNIGFVNTYPEIHLLGYVIYAFGVILGWPKEDIAKFVTGLRDQANDESVHYWCVRRVVYRRKPE